MSKPLDIRYVHAGDLTTNQAHALEWVEGSISNRYQEIAIVGNRVVGSWQYDLEWNRGKLTIDSSHTGVATRLRHRGIAQALWMHGLARWKPTRVKAIIGTDEGRDFLARMMARIAYSAPGIFLWVQTRKEDVCWDSRCEYAARALLKTLGQQRIEREAKKPKQLAAPTLAIAKAGS